MPSLEVCPNHGGSFDCLPFCELCEGKQGYDPEQLISCSAPDCPERLTKQIYAEESALCVEHSNAYFSQELDPYTLERVAHAD